jgi:hypothetical protein
LADSGKIVDFDDFHTEKSVGNPLDAGLCVSGLEVLLMSFPNPVSDCPYLSVGLSQKIGKPAQVLRRLRAARASPPSAASKRRPGGPYSRWTPSGRRRPSQAKTTPVVQYLPLRRALTNNVRIRCTWRCQAHLAMPGAPGGPQVHLASAYLKQGAPAIHRVHLWTAGAPRHDISTDIFLRGVSGAL